MDCWSCLSHFPHHHRHQRSHLHIIYGYTFHQVAVQVDDSCVHVPFHLSFRYWNSSYRYCLHCWIWRRRYRWRFMIRWIGSSRSRRITVMMRRLKAVSLKMVWWVGKWGGVGGGWGKIVGLFASVQGGVQGLWTCRWEGGRVLAGKRLGHIHDGICFGKGRNCGWKNCFRGLRGEVWAWIGR